MRKDVRQQYVGPLVRQLGAYGKRDFQKRLQHFFQVLGDLRDLQKCNGLLLFLCEVDMMVKNMYQETRKADTLVDASPLGLNVVYRTTRTCGSPWKILVNVSASTELPVVARPLSYWNCLIADIVSSPNQPSLSVPASL
jgi:hypothetical protein